MNRLGLAAALALTFAWSTRPALAETQELPTLRDATSVRAAGMAGAVRGFAASGEALLVNPAGIAATTRFNAELGATFAPATSGHLLSATAIDSKLNAEDSLALGGGVGYWHYASGTGDAARQGSAVVLGLALPIVPEVLFAGVSGRYLALSGAVRSNAVTADAGVILRPTPGLSLGAAGYNLVDVHSSEAPRAWGFGAALGREPDLHLDFDTRIDRDAQGSWKPLFSVGAEYLIAGMVQPRAGYLDDRLRGTRAIAGGLSVRLGGFALEAFFQKTLSRADWAAGAAVRLLDLPN